MKNTPYHHLIYCSILLVLLTSGCKRQRSDEGLTRENSQGTLFTLLSSKGTKIDFQNTLTEGLNTNILMYEYFYNGGGVATADLNGDGLIDIYFTSNMGENKFYINRGNMQFEDVTSISKIGGRSGPWKTGVATVDINGDGKMDLYLCYSGALPDKKRENQLFINQGNNPEGVPIFKEMAAKWGLNSAGYSNQAYFLDFDRDSDLDMILLNHNPKSLPVLNEIGSAQMLKQDDPLRGVRLFEQKNGKFLDVTVEAGINGSALTYGLGIGVSDFNNDGWPDFYVSNDYDVPDYLYINQGNGSFRDELGSQLGHSSQFSMGNDMVDINNDGLQDIFTLDMLPEDNYRQKLLLAPDNYEKFDLNVRSGFHHQYMRNMFHLNNGDDTFSEIGQLAGISNTDWSWAPLIADFDNDGQKDLYITNGYFRDYTNRDFINYMENYVRKKGNMKRQDVLEIIKNMPASDVVNYAYANQGGTSFVQVNGQWGMEHASNSNGAAYADLDNDGDLDLVVNNINQPAFIYENNAAQEGSHYLQVKLVGEGLNTDGLGTKVTLYNKGEQQKLEQMTSRGYLSAISPILHFGLGSLQKIDSLKVVWNSGKQQLLKRLSVDQRLVLEEKNAIETPRASTKRKGLFQEIKSPISHKDPTNNINDFKRQSLLINQLSRSGPCMVKGDVDMDGREDIFIGGAKGQQASLFLQQANGRFKKHGVPAFAADSESEDVAAVIFDANLDGHADIYVASGGYHDFAQEDERLQDRLYLGNGNGGFVKDITALPQLLGSKGAVAVADINGDGSPDIFVGGRLIPGRYPETPNSYLLINDGKGHFEDRITQWSPKLKELGMITDALWKDLDGDGIQELVLVGEWMPITVFKNISGKLQNHSQLYFDKPYRGWWNTIEVADFNNDGKPDIIAGNLGSNTQFQVTDSEPLELYFKDFDQNGSVDPLFCYYIQGKSYPYITRDELLGQLGGLRSKYTSYESYANATITDIIEAEELKNAGHLIANHMKTTLFLSNEKRVLKVLDLPNRAQYAPVHSIVASDFNNDGNIDLILFGNSNNYKLRIGKFDANYGTLFIGEGNGNFKYVDQQQSGLNVSGDVRNSELIGNRLLLGINEGLLRSYQILK
ncbi:MAG: VCBS repeat-containing protein [Sediminicola sp.]